MPRKPNIQRILQKRKDFNRSWFSRPDNIAAREDDLAYIAQNVGADAPGTRRNIADSLRRLGTLHALKGEVELFDGDIRGWDEIHRAWLYHDLSLRIMVSEFQKSRVLGQFRPIRTLESEASACALCLFYALAVGRDIEAEFFAGTIRVMLYDSDVVPASYWLDNYFETFAVHLYSLFKKQKLESSRNLDRVTAVYKAILEAWDSPALLVEALCAACDFHCQKIESSDRYYEEFRRPPYDLVPAEILAVLVVRRALGLFTPPVGHPLLGPPFNEPHGNPADIEDPLLERVESSLW